MFKRREIIIDIMKKTSCTKDQAKYLEAELHKLPDIKDVVLQHMEKVNLSSCKNVKISRCFECVNDDEDISRCFECVNDTVNISAVRVCDINGILIIQKCLWKFIAEEPGYIGFEIQQLEL